jgi:hypothetical protein
MLLIFKRVKDRQVRRSLRIPVRCFDRAETKKEVPAYKPGLLCFLFEAQTYLERGQFRRCCLVGFKSLACEMGPAVNQK